MDAQNNEIHMPHKSIFIKVFFKWRFAVAIATAILILFLFSCKKIVEDTQMDIAQQYFKNNILNSDFVIDSAYNNGIDVTARFAGFDFFNRSWRFLEKNLPIMKLAPWGMPDPAVTRLYMRRL